MRGTDNDVDTGGVGRHRRPEPYRARHRKTEEIRSKSRRAARRPAAAVLLASIATGSVTLATGSVAAPEMPSTALDTTVPQVADGLREPASRSMDRESRVAAAEAPKRTSTRQAPTSPAATPSPQTSAKSTPRSVTKAKKPRPVGGLTQAQMDYAAIIVRVGQKLQLPKEAYVVAIATSLQESKLLNLANWSVPESLNLEHDGVGGDHDSVGLFQQRPSSGWGTVEELMNPALSAQKFYQALAKVVGWQGLPVAAAAQAVQISAFPDAYAQHALLATQIVSALVSPA
jgi:hypothetical protein